nr:hypothetical protein [Tanacetum cinerariifolium]GEY80430.1 hypothetical protein [Tanacetum cinerariifolium]
DTPDTPPSQDPYEVTVAWWKRRVVVRSSPPSPLMPSLVPGALSLVRDHLLLPRKRIKDFDNVTDFVVSSEVGYVPYIPREIRTYVRVEDGTVAEEEAESSVRGTTKIGVNRVTHPVVMDDIAECVREDFPDLVNKIKVNELSKVMGNVLIPKNKVKGVITRAEKMTSEATPSKEINETNKNEPPKFEQDVQEEPHDDVVENKSLSIPERTT